MFGPPPEVAKDGIDLNAPVRGVTFDCGSYEPVSLLESVRKAIAEADPSRGRFFCIRMNREMFDELTLNISETGSFHPGTIEAVRIQKLPTFVLDGVRIEVDDTAPDGEWWECYSSGMYFCGRGSVGQ